MIKRADNLLVSREELRSEIELLIRDFRPLLESGKLREKVLGLVQVLRKIRKLGKSLVPREDAKGLHERILFYLKKYPRQVIGGEEINVISGIQEHARRIRELRVQFGWKIISGLTAKAMANDDEVPESQATQFINMSPSDYMLVSEQQDLEAALRWNVANSIRKRKTSVSDKILEYLKINVGKEVTGEELRYLANKNKEFTRRVRELRRDDGWPIMTKNSGRPDLDIGVYLLESLRQAPENDREIPDPVYRKVLQRDEYSCTKCKWNHDLYNRSDPRHLEVHHVKFHAAGGDNSEENLTTLCTICHDDIHRKKK